MAKPLKRPRKRTSRLKPGRRKIPQTIAESSPSPLPDQKSPAGIPAQAQESSFFVLYQKAFESCGKMWPFFLIQSFVALLNMAMLGFVFLVGCWPLIQTMAQSFGDILQNPESYDPEQFSNKFLSMASSDSSWVGIFLGLAVIYLVWSLLLGALTSGGIYGGFWRFKREGKIFSMGEFIKDALGLFLPYLGTLLLLFAISTGVVLAFRLVGMEGVILLQNLHMGAGLTMAVLVVMGLPFFIIYLCVLLVLVVYSFSVKAWVGGGKGIVLSLALGWKSCWAKGWHFIKGIVLALVILAAFFIALQLFLMLTLLVPLIGILSLFGMLLTTAVLLIFMALYFPALSVLLLDEGENQA